MDTDEALTFSPLPLSGAFLISGTRHEDDRGWFARTWCARELAAQGLTAVIAQSSFSSNTARGTLRGLHYQAPPHAETKVVTLRPRADLGRHRRPAAGSLHVRAVARRACSMATSCGSSTSRRGSRMGS